MLIEYFLLELLAKRVYMTNLLVEDSPDFVLAKHIREYSYADIIWNYLLSKIGKAKNVDDGTIHHTMRINL